MIAGMKLLKAVGKFLNAWWPVILLAGAVSALAWFSYSAGCQRWEGQYLAQAELYEDEVEAHERTRDEKARLEEQVAQDRRAYADLERRIADAEVEHRRRTEAALARQVRAAQQVAQGYEAEVARIKAVLAELEAAESCHGAWLEVVR